MFLHYFVLSIYALRDDKHCWEKALLALLERNDDNCASKKQWPHGPREAQHVQIIACLVCAPVKIAAYVSLLLSPGALERLVLSPSIFRRRLNAHPRLNGQREKVEVPVMPCSGLPCVLCFFTQDFLCVGVVCCLCVKVTAL